MMLLYNPVDTRNCNDLMDFESTRLDKTIRRLYGKNIPQSIIEKAIRSKDILVNNKRASSSMKVTESDDIYVHESFKKHVNQTEKPIVCDQNKFKTLIIYEDENIIAINKPSGLAVQLGTNTKLSVDIMAKSYNPEARLVHRIDKDTSGITILSKNLKTSRFMLHMFKNKFIQKKYTAVISVKNLSMEHGTIDAPLFRDKHKVFVDKENGKVSITDYRLIKRLDNDLAIIELFPKTGRTHQIRVHMQYIGCPILGDKKYGGRNYKKLCLHAFSVNFKNLEGSNIKIKAPLPEHFSMIDKPR